LSLLGSNFLNGPNFDNVIVQMSCTLEGDNNVIGLRRYLDSGMNNWRVK
jgi:hypothetical protein